MNKSLPEYTEVTCKRCSEKKYTINIFQNLCYNERKYGAIHKQSPQFCGYFSLREACAICMDYKLEDGRKLNKFKGRRRFHYNNTGYLTPVEPIS